MFNRIPPKYVRFRRFIAIDHQTKAHTLETVPVALTQEEWEVMLKTLNDCGMGRTKYYDTER